MKDSENIDYLQLSTIAIGELDFLPTPVPGKFLVYGFLIDLTATAPDVQSIAKETFKQLSAIANGLILENDAITEDH
jgi:hypothetical protein